MKYLRNSFFLLRYVAVACLAILLLTGNGAHPQAQDAPAAVSPAAVHDLYNPARTALVNARRQLSETFMQEQDIIRQRQNVHRELDESLRLLASARNHDPSMTVPIEDLRQRIAALESDPCAIDYDGKSLKELYDGLLADFETLIEHY